MQQIVHKGMDISIALTIKLFLGLIALVKIEIESLWGKILNLLQIVFCSH